MDTMTRSEFARVASDFGLDLAAYTAKLCKVRPAQIDLWVSQWARWESDTLDEIGGHHE
jgi:hypothetical protein